MASPSSLRPDITRHHGYLLGFRVSQSTRQHHPSRTQSFVRFHDLLGYLYAYTLVAFAVSIIYRLFVPSSGDDAGYPFVWATDPLQAVIQYNGSLILVAALYLIAYGGSKLRDSMARQIGRDWEQVIRPTLFADEQSFLLLPSLQL